MSLINYKQNRSFIHLSMFKNNMFQFNNNVDNIFWHVKTIKSILCQHLPKSENNKYIVRNLWNMKFFHWIYLKFSWSPFFDVINLGGGASRLFASNDFTINYHYNSAITMFYIWNVHVKFVLFYIRRLVMHLQFPIRYNEVIL